MKFYGEMRVQGSGPLDGDRFDALAYALAEIEQTDPAVAGGGPDRLPRAGLGHRLDDHRPADLELAVTMLIATVRTAIYPNGDIAGSWKFLAETADGTIRPAADRRAPGDQRPVSAAPAGGGRPLRGASPAAAAPRGGEPGGGGLPARGGEPGGGLPARGGEPGGGLPARGGEPGGGLPARGGAPAGGTSGRGRAPAGDPVAGGRWPDARSRRERALERRAQCPGLVGRRPAGPGGPAPGDAVPRETRPGGAADGAGHSRRGHRRRKRSGRPATGAGRADRPVPAARALPLADTQPHTRRRLTLHPRRRLPLHPRRLTPHPPAPDPPGPPGQRRPAPGPAACPRVISPATSRADTQL